MTAAVKSWLAIGLAGVGALAAGLYFGLHDRTSHDASAVFAISLPDESGQQHSLEQWRGKVLVVNFWATWCAPCREEMPQFVKAQQEYGARGLQFVGIAVDDKAKASLFAKELGLNYPALIGGFDAIETSKVLGNRLSALPFTVVVDRAGKVETTRLGQLTPDELRSILKKLL